MKKMSLWLGQSDRRHFHEGPNKAFVSIDAPIYIYTHSYVYMYVSIYIYISIYDIYSSNLAFSIFQHCHFKLKHGSSVLAPHVFPDFVGGMGLRM